MFNDLFPFDSFTFLCFFPAHILMPTFSFTSLTVFIHCFLNFLSFSIPYSNSLHFILPYLTGVSCFIHSPMDLSCSCLLGHLGNFFSFSLECDSRAMGSNPDQQHKQFIHHPLCLSFFICKTGETELVSYLF